MRASVVAFVRNGRQEQCCQKHLQTMGKQWGTIVMWRKRLRTADIYNENLLRVWGQAQDGKRGVK
jgi:hypothetical protein